MNSLFPECYPLYEFLFFFLSWNKEIKERTVGKFEAYACDATDRMLVGFRFFLKQQRTPCKYFSRRGALSSELSSTRRSRFSGPDDAVVLDYNFLISTLSARVAFNEVTLHYAIIASPATVIPLVCTLFDVLFRFQSPRPPSKISPAPRQRPDVSISVHFAPRKYREFRSWSPLLARI